MYVLQPQYRKNAEGIEFEKMSSKNLANKNESIYCNRKLRYSSSTISLRPQTLFLFYNCYPCASDLAEIDSLSMLNNGSVS